MTSPELARAFATLTACRKRIETLADAPEHVSPDTLSDLREQLCAVDAELHAWDKAAHRRPTPTPTTLSSLLSLVRADLASQLSDDASPEENLAQVVHLAQQLIPGTEHAGVSLLRIGAPIETPAATSSVPAAIDQIQSEIGNGPSFFVSAVREVLRIDDLRNDARWPRYAERLQGLDVRSVLVCELPLTRGAAGLLSLYSSRRRAFSTTAELVAPVFASRAALSLAHADEVSNLRRAIGSRQVIGEAVGILMERHRLSSDQAFERLVAASQHRHVKVRDIALRVTETGEEPDAVLG
jgi:hypothetical protein